MAVSTASAAAMDGWLRKLDYPADNVAVGPAAACEDAGELAGRRREWQRIREYCGDLALKHGITEEVIAEEIRLYREEERAKNK